MIKTTITPENNSYNLIIPNNYIGKKIEILFYALDELIEEQPAKKTMADFWGKLSDATANDLHKKTTEGRL
ncbi:MAG: hypothetical protein ABL940_03895 [Bacteroidia bacterium]